MDTIVLGLDGATWDILDPLIEDGKLPNIEKLVNSGYSGTLESTFPPITAPAWLSMATGQNPGKTGVYYFVNRTNNDSFDFETFGSEKFKGKSFWDVLNSQGYSVGLFNYPMLYPPYEMDGFMVSGIGSPENDTITYPDKLIKDLNEVTDGYEIKVPYADPKYSNRPDSLISDLHRMIDKKEKAMEFLLNKKSTDVFFGIISATDWAQHYFWKYHDESHCLNSGNSKYSSSLEDIWGRVDETVGMVSEFAEEEGSQLFLVSDHGFGPVNSTFYVNNWLQEQGYLVTEDKSFTDKLRTNYFPYLRRIGEPVVSLIPQLNNLAVSVGSSVKGNPKDEVDFEKSIAFAPEQGYACGFIYMLSDDESDRERIINSLNNLKDNNGNDLDVKIDTSDEIYTGPKSKFAPDILFEIENLEYAVSYHYSSDNEIITQQPPSTSRSGGHRRNGIFIFNGDEISEGHSQTKQSIMDIAPTILFTHNCPIPETIDGSIIKEAFTESILDDKEVERLPASEIHTDLTQKSNRDTDEVKDRLEDLGYM